MQKSVRFQVLLVLLCVFAVASTRTARASGADQGTSSSITVTPQITGTDPEPIDPGVVNLIFYLLGLA